MHVAALAGFGGKDRGPFTLPIWCQFNPPGEACGLTSAGSRKTALTGAGRRLTLMVDRVWPTVGSVSAEGPVTRIAPGADEMLLEISERYLQPEKVPAYIEFAEAEPGRAGAIYLRSRCDG
jgi:hypothetical protein